MLIVLSCSQRSTFNKEGESGDWIVQTICGPVYRKEKEGEIAFFFMSCRCHQHVLGMGRTSGFSCKRAQSTLVTINVPLLKRVAYLVEIGSCCWNLETETGAAEDMIKMFSSEEEVAVDHSSLPYISDFVLCASSPTLPTITPSKTPGFHV